MGLFKGIKDIANLTKEAKKLQDQQLEQSGYKPGMRGAMSQLGDLVGQATEGLKDVTEQMDGKDEILAGGIPGQGIIIGHGVPARGAQWFNMEIDMEIHVPGRDPYRVNNQYMVPSGATLGPGVALPIKVDPEDPAKIAIDWDAAEQKPTTGEVRPAGAAAAAPAPAADDAEGMIAQLERLGKLRDSGILTEAEFAEQKARILGD